MPENNVMITEENTAPEKKKSGGSWAWLIFVCLGIIIFVIGFLLYDESDLSRYNSKNLTDFNESFDVGDINNLSLDIDWANLTIIESEDDKISIDAHNVPETFKAEADGSTLKVKFDTSKHHIYFIPSFGTKKSNDTRIEISLPKKEFRSFDLDLGAGNTAISDIDCDSFKVDCGAGNLDIRNIKCSSGDIDCGAGNLNIKEMNCEGKLDLDGGAGNITISGSVLGGLDLDNGVGEFEFSGTMNGNIDADGGVGGMTFRLTNPSSDFNGDDRKYNIDIDNGIGKTNVVYDQE